MSARAVMDGPYSGRNRLRWDAGSNGFHRATDRLDVLRRRSATASNQPHAIPHELLGVRGHVLRRAEINISSSIFFGLPAFGCTDNFLDVICAILSMMSSIV